MIRYLLILLLLCISGTALAAASTQWRIDSSLQLDKRSLEALKLRYPSIESRGDLAQLLVSLGYKIPSTVLRADFQDKKGEWYITGKTSPTLSQIDFELVPLSILPTLKTSTSTWIGQVHSEALANRVKMDVEQFLQRSGYKYARADISIVTTDSVTEYSVIVDIGPPCVVNGVQWPGKLPSVVVEDVSIIGEVCDQSQASQMVSNVENKLRSLGWISSKLEFESFSKLDADSNAKVIVTGVFGPKFSYEFLDNKDGLPIVSSISIEDRKNLAPSVTGPDAVPMELVEVFKRKGYLDVKITGPFVRSELDDLVIYQYRVDRGSFFSLDEVKIEGNEHFSTNTVLGILNLNLAIRDRQSNPFSQEQVFQGVETLKERYRRDGYWDVKVIDRVSFSNPQFQTQTQLSISIDEGARRILDRLEINGVRSVSKSDVISALDLEMGIPLDQGVLNESQKAVRKLYAAEGFYYAELQFDLVERKGVEGDVSVEITAKVDEGTKVRFGDVLITGLVKTEQKVVLRELLFETGDWYDPELVIKSRQALLKLGVFSSVVILPIDQAAGFQRSDMLDVRVEVRESPSRSLSFGPGWSSYFGLRYNFEGALSNLFGTGRQIYSKASFNQEKSQYAIGPRTLIGRSLSLGYLEPHLLDLPVDGTLSVNQSAFSTDDIWSLTRGGEVELSHTLRRVLPGARVGLFLGRKLNEEEGRASAKDAFLADTYRVGKTGIRFALDERNVSSWPTKGYTLNGELAWARYGLGGDVRYFRWDVSNNYYFGIFDDLVVAFGAHLTSFQGVTRSNKDNLDILPASERLNAGGTESVRGFRERSLGPLVRRPNIKDDGTWPNCDFSVSPAGGTRRAILKLETRYRWTQTFASTLFVDSGNTSFTGEERDKFKEAFESVQQVKDNNCNELAVRSIEDSLGYDYIELLSNPKNVWLKNFTSFGLAANFITPIGALNLAYGVPWREPKSNKCLLDEKYCFSRVSSQPIWWRRGEVHFNVGANF